MAATREAGERGQAPPLRPEGPSASSVEQASGEAPASTRRRRLLARLLLLGVSLGFALLAGELMVRVARPQEVMTISPRGLYAPDPPRRYRLRPGYRGTMTNHVEFRHAVAVDRHGLRSGPLAPAPAPVPGAAASVASSLVDLPVLALGDSFTFGVGAGPAETFPARLQARLGSPAVAWNAGVPGYGVPDAAAWYGRWAGELPAKPVTVVVAVFLANDLQDAAPGSPVRVVDGELVVGGERGGVRRWFYYHSHLFRLLKTSLLEGPLRAKLGFAEPWARRERRAELALYGPVLPAAAAAGAAATERAIAELASLTARRGQRLLAVLVPSLPQVDPARWRALHRELGADPGGHDPRRPNRIFAELFARHRVEVLDATDALAAAVGRGERVYYPRDQHLTPAGYDLLAREVAAALRRR